MLACMLPLVLVLASTKQDLPPNPIPNPVTQVYALDGTNRIEFTLRCVDTGNEQRGYLGMMQCINECKGQKHYRHQDCDFSCDKRCHGPHKATDEPMYGRPEGMGEGYTWQSGAIGGLKEAAQRFGAALDVKSIEYTAFRDLKATYNDDDPKNFVKYDLACFNEKPCSSIVRFPMERNFIVSIDWKLYRETEADGKMIRTEGPSGSQQFTQLSIPIKNKFEDVFHERCLCNVIKEIKQTGYVLPDPPQDAPQTASSGGVRIGTDPNGPLLGQQNLDGLQFGVVCNDMNQGEVSFTNPFLEQISINIPPGTMLITDDEDVQDVVILVALAMTLPPAAQTTVHGPMLDSKGKLRLGCIEMTKHEPNDKVKYRVVPAVDSVLPKLAAYTDKSRFRGPWDQMRLWIYTDGAGYQDIRKLLIPCPGPGTYLRVLKDVHDSGAHLDDAKFVNCFSPDLLSAFDAQPPHMRWFAEEMARRAPGGVLQWAKSEASRYPQSLGPTMDQGAPETAAALIDALCASPDKRTQEAGLRLLAAVPEGARASVIDRVPSAWGLAWSPEKDIADRARGLLDQMNPAAKDFYIANTTK